LSDFDSPWKEVLELFFPAFLQFFFPQVNAAIDWSREYEALDKELQQIVREAVIGRRYQGMAQGRGGSVGANPC
jgi:hypothetical protein